MADVDVLVDVEFDQEIVVASSGIDLGGDLGLGKRVGDDVGLAELAFDLDEEGNHRCRLHEHFPAKWNLDSRKKMLLTNKPRVFYSAKPVSTFAEYAPGIASPDAI